MLASTYAREGGDNAGIGGAGWFVDLELDFRGSHLEATGSVRHRP